MEGGEYGGRGGGGREGSMDGRDRIEAVKEGVERRRGTEEGGEGQDGGRGGWMGGRDRI